MQGVGLRFRACYAAGQTGVTGFVRNLDDGTVEIEAEGEREEIAEFLRLIQNGRFIDIESIDEKTIPVENDRTFRRE